VFESFDHLLADLYCERRASRGHDAAESKQAIETTGDIACTASFRWLREARD
jgi:hypothetical protein